MQLLNPFDATKFNPEQSVGNLPVGKHPVIIESSEVKPTQSNDGGYLQLNLRIVDGPQAGTTGAYRLHLYNKSAKAVEIASSQLSAVCHVTGVFQVNDSSQLHNIPFIVEVGLQKGEEGEQKGYTEVKRVFDANGNEPGKKNQAPQQAPQQAQQTQQAPAGAWGQPSQGQFPGAPQAPQQAPQTQQPTQPPANNWVQPQQVAQQPPASNWQQPQQAQQPAQAPAQSAPWGQQPPAGNAPPWGQR